MIEDAHILAGSHIPLLTRIVDLSEGEILEVGTGYFSTSLLHWLAHVYKRTVYSYENNPNWYKKFLRSSSKYHKFFFVNNWDEIPLTPPSGKRWGVIFIDHSPTDRRIIEIEKFAKIADFIVIHDTETDKEKYYHYSKIWPLFKYIYHFNKIYPWTSVVSNFYNHKLLPESLK
jgi:hypothetical protein